MRIILTLLCLLIALPAHAHFGLLIPRETMVLDKKEAAIPFTIAFCHPFSGTGMNMSKPGEFFVESSGARTSLLDKLKPDSYMNAAAFKCEYTVARPGIYQFALVPQPYYEEAEDSFIIHYTKTVISAYGAEDGWSVPLGLPIEIIPLSRPFGNYAGNSFTGRVLRNGKPLPDCIVEVENLNYPARHRPPNPYFETQTIRTDENGIFTFGIPWAGWWGFAALTEGEEKLEKGGSLKDVELGGVIWTRFDEPIPGRD